MCPPANVEGLTRAEAARRLQVIPAPCAAGEDSSNGILSAHAGMRVVAMPNRASPPSETALKISDSAIPSARSAPRSPKRIEEVR
jgi:beta-phosphoglucomutase-like phosphatase (HAD superfamily)